MRRGIEKDNMVLDEWFAKQAYSAKGREFAVILVNDGNHLADLKTHADLWNVQLIEEEFGRLMFEIEGA